MPILNQRKSSLVRSMAPMWNQPKTLRCRRPYEVDTSLWIFRAGPSRFVPQNRFLTLECVHVACFYWTLVPLGMDEVNAAVFQYQNQRLLQQIDKQKHDLQDLESKIKELKDKQGSYDEMLITVNQIWNQLVDDLILLGLCAGGSQKALQILDGADYSGGSIPSCSAEEMFLCRLLQRDSIEANGNDEIAKYVEEAPTLRHTSTRELLKLLEHTIYSHREKTESIVHTLDGKISSEVEAVEGNG
ncbi:hypothetical protein CerSpe_248710 [Prunus speciosa]